jgi:hypothetical protein
MAEPSPDADQRPPIRQPVGTGRPNSSTDEVPVWRGAWAVTVIEISWALRWDDVAVTGINTDWR